MNQIGEWIANLPPWAVALIVVVLGLFWLQLKKIGDDKKIGHLSVQSTRETIESLIIAIILVFGLIRPFIAQAFFIPSPSMEPTLQVGDRLLVNKMVYRFREPKRGDIIVFRAAAYVSQDGKEHDLVKRVIGLPGDKVEVKDNTLYLNGKRQSANYTMDGDYLDYEMPPVKVQKGRLFVMGDNRNDSYDSHCWGQLERKRVIGKAQLMFWPLNRIGIIR